jgi:hypothetical protein
MNYGVVDDTLGLSQRQKIYACSQGTTKRPNTAMASMAEISALSTVQILWTTEAQPQPACNPLKAR